MENHPKKIASAPAGGGPTPLGEKKFFRASRGRTQKKIFFQMEKLPKFFYLEKIPLLVPKKDFSKFFLERI